MVNGNICLQDRFLKLPKMQPVKIKFHRMIPEGWKLKSVTVSREPSGKYFASLLFDCENQTAEKRQAEKYFPDGSLLTVTDFSFHPSGIIRWSFIFTGCIFGSFRNLSCRQIFPFTIFVV